MTKPIYYAYERGFEKFGYINIGFYIINWLHKGEDPNIGRGFYMGCNNMRYLDIRFNSHKNDMIEYDIKDFCQLSLSNKDKEFTSYFSHFKVENKMEVKRYDRIKGVIYKNGKKIAQNGKDCVDIYDPDTGILVNSIIKVGNEMKIIKYKDIEIIRHEGIERCKWIVDAYIESTTGIVETTEQCIDLYFYNLQKFV